MMGLARSSHVFAARAVTPLATDVPLVTRFCPPHRRSSSSDSRHTAARSVVSNCHQEWRCNAAATTGVRLHVIGAPRSVDDVLRVGGIVVVAAPQKVAASI
jgi:hypothetical protein